MKIVVLTTSGSRFGWRIIQGLLAKGVSLAGVVAVTQPASRQWRLFRSVARRVGWLEAVYFGLRRVAIEPRRDAGKPPSARDYRRLGIPVGFTAGTNSEATLAALGGLEPDLLLLGQTGLVGANLLALPTLGTLNAHPGILPEYRGVDVFRWAVLAGDWDKIGVTVHWVDRGVDTGPIIARRRYRVDPRRSVAAQTADLDRLATGAMVETVVEMVESGALTGSPQTESSGRQYYKMSLKDERAAEAALKNLDPK